jgi:hypothetical protein
MAGRPARKSRSTYNWPVLCCISSNHLLGVVARGRLIASFEQPLARFVSSYFQVLIIVGWEPPQCGDYRPPHERACYLRTLVSQGIWHRTPNHPFTGKRMATSRRDRRNFLHWVVFALS